MIVTFVTSLVNSFCDLLFNNNKELNTFLSYVVISCNINQCFR